jgi:hypothetical protein
MKRVVGNTSLDTLDIPPYSDMDIFALGRVVHTNAI